MESMLRLRVEILKANQTVAVVLRTAHYDRISRRSTYTIEMGHMPLAEKQKGSIEQGKLADLIVYL